MNTDLPLSAAPLTRHSGQTLSEQLAGQIAAKSPLAIATSKQALNYARDHGTADALAQMTLLQSAAFDIGEMALAIEAWKTRQPAAYAPLDPTPAD